MISTYINIRRKMKAHFDLFDKGSNVFWSDAVVDVEEIVDNVAAAVFSKLIPISNRNMD